MSDYEKAKGHSIGLEVVALDDEGLLISDVKAGMYGFTDRHYANDVSMRLIGALVGTVDEVRKEAAKKES